MSSATGAILVLVTEGFLLGLLRKYIIERRVFLLCASISAVAAFFAVNNIENAKITVFNDARNSTTISWLAFAVISIAALILAKYPDNDITQTFVHWNIETNGLVAISSLILLLIVFTSRASASV
jgi:uncharacterized membrane protein